jgi:hypothetical protein
MSTHEATTADRQARTRRNGIGALLGLAALVSLAAGGCETKPNGPVANPTATSGSTSQAKEPNVTPPPATAKTADPAPSATATTADPAPSATAKTADPAPKAGVCRSLWTTDAERLVIRTQAGHGAYYREFEYVRATRTLRVDDSDLYEKGVKGELKTPRVTKESKTLTADEARELEGILTKTCFTKDELARRCAPGGCRRLTVYTRGGEAEVEDADTTDLLKRMSAHFPKLRTA